ncbi:hypothetical protein DERF_005979 [Dermatophagoides farinae]|uniref:Uncharacterized protein n=1 Tax=Dermatophagoides farinae TaxID=6954 RepID=A0A922L6Q8_DERFA|nr:hypothetical protein DERF_005979 [Dermatophagoides farinae]
MLFILYSEIFPSFFKSLDLSSSSSWYGSRYLQMFSIAVIHIWSLSKIIISISIFHFVSRICSTTKKNEKIVILIQFGQPTKKKIALTVCKFIKNIVCKDVCHIRMNLLKHFNDD